MARLSVGFVGLALACTPPDGGDRPPRGDPFVAPPTADTGPATVPPTTRPSSDAALLELALGIPLAPPFDPAISTYAVRTSALAAELEVVAVPADPAATVGVVLETVDGLDVAYDGPFTPVADHRVLVTVTSPDGLVTSRYAVGLLPDGFPEIAWHAPGAASPGWLLLATFPRGPSVGGEYAMALDERGTPGWWRAAPDQGYDLRVGRDERLSWIGTPNGLKGPKEGLVIGPGYVLERTVLPADDAGRVGIGINVHEFERLADGRSLILANVPQLEDLTPWGGEPATLVVHQLVQELDADGDLLFSWSSEGVTDYDDLAPQLLASARDFWELEHANAVDYDLSDGHLLVSLRHPSQVLKVARFDDTIAGREVQAGEIAWRLGGAGSDFTFVGDPREGGWNGFSEQHAPRMIAPDTLVVFDNSTSWSLGRTGAARYARYALDTTAWTATLVESYEIPSDQPSPVTGSVQVLPDGHVVIGWGAAAGDLDVTELDAAGEVVLEMGFPDSTFKSYRAWKFEGDPIAGTWTHPVRALPPSN